MGWCCLHHLEGKKTVTLDWFRVKLCKQGGWEKKSKSDHFWESTGWVALGNILLSSYRNNKVWRKTERRRVEGNAGVETIQFTCVTLASSLGYSLNNWEIKYANEISVTEAAEKLLIFFSVWIVCYLCTILSLESSYSSSRCLLSCLHQSHTCLCNYLRQTEQAF